jgi:hypothetical protein
MKCNFGTHAAWVRKLARISAEFDQSYSVRNIRGVKSVEVFTDRDRRAQNELMYDQLEVCCLSGLDLHALRLIARADQGVGSRGQIEFENAGTICGS